MKILFSNFILIFFAGLCYSQNLSCLYELKFRPNPKKDSIVTNTYYLDIYKKQSIFREENERYSDSLTEKTGLGMGRKTLFVTDLFAKKKFGNK